MTIQYTIDASRLTIRDVIAIQEAGNDLSKLLTIYERCLILPDGVSMYDLPASHMTKIAQAIKQEMTADLGN